MIPDDSLSTDITQSPPPPLHRGAAVGAEGDASPPSTGERKQFDLLADEFIGRIRLGEHPKWEEYAQRFPDLAQQIALYFPVIAVMEQVSPRDDADEAPAETHVRPSMPSPQKLGDYELVRELGRGGMGIVYEARQVSLDRIVALKLLPDQLGKDTAAVERFRREAQAAARLEHPHIVSVYEVGEANDWLYFTMQLIRGQNLDFVIRQVRQLRERDGRETPPRPSTAQLLLADPSLSLSESDCCAETLRIADASSTVEPKRSFFSFLGLSRRWNQSRYSLNTAPYHRNVARLGIQVADALAYAHRRGIIHRDIKPSNLIVDAFGQLWVTDFGLAKLSDSELTNTGDILGTARYMAPEQFHGRADERTDVYSLGLTLYEMVALRPAYLAPDRLQTIRQIATIDPARLRSIDSTTPLDLETIIHTAIKREPSDRYATCDLLTDDLQRFLDNRPISVRQPSLLERGRQWTLRNPRVSVALSLVFVVLLGWGVTSAYLLRQTQLLNDELRADNYSSEMLSLSQAMIQPGLVDIQRGVESVSPEFRGIEWTYFERVADMSHLVLRAHEWPVMNLACSPTGEWFASCDYFTSLCIWHPGNTKPTFRLELEYFRDGSRLEPSRDGKHLLVATEKNFFLIDAVTGTIKFLFPKKGGETALSSDATGNYFMICYEGGYADILDVRSPHAPPAQLIAPQVDNGIASGGVVVFGDET